MIACFIALLCAAEPHPAWPGFRGTGNSLATVENLPVTWDDATALAWSTPLPGYGQSSPVVWGDAVFVTAASGESKENLHVACYDLKSGKQRWKHDLPATQKVAVSDYVTRSAPTPFVDAERVYAFFESGELVALDHTGKEVWQRHLTTEFGEFKGNHGVGSSLAASHDSLLVLVDHDGPSYLLAVDKATGRDRWKAEREERVSWSSPIIAAESPSQAILSSNGVVDGYDLATGKRLWRFAGIKGNTVASATITDQAIIIGSSEGGQQLALPRKLSGDVAESSLLWRADDVTSSFASPLVYRDLVFSVNKAGVANCSDAKSGKSLWTQRLPGSCWASPIGAAGRVYFFGKDGVTTVVAAEAKYQRLAENRLTIEGRVYGVAAVSGAFVLRTGEQLICVGQP
ncbi:MAG: PQQ-binding-like beta-propeller repeat protein [Planctomycetaceae bacterium]|nr:PQQ-binding-like beta-propeller repeat protein [Planctomycetaceae bacterium]